MISLWRSIVHQLAGSHARKEQSALPLKMALDISYPLVWETSQSPTRILVATESLSAIEAHRVGPLAVRDYVTEEIWIMLLFLVKRGHSVEFMFSPSDCGIPRNEAAVEEAAVASSLPAIWGIPIGHVDFLTAVERLCWKEVSEEEEGAHTTIQALVGIAKTLLLVSGQMLCHDPQLCAQLRCDSCPLFGRMAHALQITGSPLCR
ncbi:hypothetical protein TcYC6_0035530 [Trypanosoma cruzi]|nr:hypothetical protein TcYC6_0035530 [Trypanosoma cruzi]